MAAALAVQRDLPCVFGFRAHTGGGSIPLPVLHLDITRCDSKCVASLIETPTLRNKWWG